MPGVSFDRAADYYDLTRGYDADSADRIRDAIVAHTGAGAGTRFLELGVGTGRIALPFIRAGYDYTGVDLSQAMMDRLTAKVAADPARETYRFQLRQGDITQLPFEDSTFDVIIMVHVLHLVADWQAVLREAARVLRPGGRLVLGQDGDPNEGMPSDDAATPAPLRVRRKWLELRRAFGVDRPAGRANLWMEDRQVVDRIAAFLQQMGAATESVRLAEYTRPPITPREMLARLRERVYSSDWELPDEVHAEMLSQLEQWFAGAIAAPDTPAVLPGTFTALVATWPF
jgi:SAM-dependent methyltransferase